MLGIMINLNHCLNVYHRLLLASNRDIQWLPKLFNKVYFQFFSAPLNAKNIPNSDSSRENCFQQEYMKMKIIARLPKTRSPENQKPSFSAPRMRKYYFVQPT